MEILKLAHVSFSYKKQFVLQDISYAFDEGKIYSIIGHNGAGKTTLIRLILNILKLQEGEIIINGNPKLSYVPDLGGLFEFLTVDENLEIFLRLNKRTNSFSKNFIERSIQQWHLMDKRKTQIKYLSMGQKQRISIIVSEVNCPDLLLMDEPSNGIDIISQELLNQHLLSLKKSGRTVIIASHDINLIEKVSDEIIILEKGKITYSEAMSNINDLTEVYKRFTGGELNENIPSISI